MSYLVVKQLFPAPSASRSGSATHTDPWFAQRKVYVGRLSGSNDTLWEFSEVERKQMQMLRLQS